ncbi:MAG: V4R domain-containing protein [Thermoproteota archaeon]
MHELFECLPFKGKQDRAVSQIFRGCLVGIFQKLYGKTFSVTESECIAKGDPYCTFRIKALK